MFPLQVPFSKSLYVFAGAANWRLSREDLSAIAIVASDKMAGNNMAKSAERGTPQMSVKVVEQRSKGEECKMCYIGHAEIADGIFDWLGKK